MGATTVGLSERNLLRLRGITTCYAMRHRTKKLARNGCKSQRPDETQTNLGVVRCHRHRCPTRPPVDAWNNPVFRTARINLAKKMSIAEAILLCVRRRPWPYRLCHEPNTAHARSMGHLRGNQLSKKQCDIRPLSSSDPDRAFSDYVYGHSREFGHGERATQRLSRRHSLAVSDMTP